MEGDYHRHGPRGSFGGKALNRQVFIIGYLQWVEIKNLYLAMRSTAYRASILAVCEWHCDTPQEWHPEATRKHSRRWQRCMT